jgi:hypothetical protein
LGIQALCGSCGLRHIFRNTSPIRPSRPRQWHLVRPFTSAVLEPAAFASDYAVFDESQLEGSLQSLDDYKAAAAELGIKVGKMKKEEIKDAIKVADVESRFVFREDAIARLYDGKQILTPTLMMAIRSIQGKHLSSHWRFAFAGERDG